jgi:hypothetical protein
VRALAVAAVLVSLLWGCGGREEDDLTAARATVKRYFAALAAQRADVACRQLTRRSRSELAEVGERTLRIRPASCSATVDRLFRSQAASSLRRLSHAKVTRSRLDGKEAVITVEGVPSPFRVVREDGDWRIRSSPAVEADRESGG